MQSLMQFWRGFEQLSLHEIMHPPRWPGLAGQHFCLASVLNFLIRQSQVGPAVEHVTPHETHDEDMPDIMHEEPTPWIELQPSPHMPLPVVQDSECAVIFMHESSAPVKFVVSDICSVREIIQAQVKLQGHFNVTQVFDADGSEVPLNHVISSGQLICIRCSSDIVQADTGATPTDSQAIAEYEAGLVYRPPDPTAIDEVSMHETDVPAVSPTLVWSQPAVQHDVIRAMRQYDGGETVSRHLPGLSDSLLSASPLLSLKSEQFQLLQIPVVMNMQHLWALRQQLLRVSDRALILANQQGLWADDEFRYHLHLLVDAHEQFQKKHASAKVVTCTVLDPLLITGWTHHGHEGCSEWGKTHPEVKANGCPVITCCLLDGHWLPLIMTPVNGVLHVNTWDAQSHDHARMNHTIDAVGKALGFEQVLVMRQHRLFLSSDMCGAMAMAFLNHALLNVMLPTCPAEVLIIHERLRTLFADAVQNSPHTHRPWIWGAGDEVPAAASSHVAELVAPAVEGHTIDPSMVSFSHQCMPLQERLSLLESKGPLMADDEVRFHMVSFMKEFEHAPPRPDPTPGFVMMGPLLLETWNSVGKGMCDAWCRQNAELVRLGHKIVAVFFVQEHWFPIWFIHQRDTLIAHRIADSKISTDTVLPLIVALKEGLGFQAIVDHVLPDALPEHALCGAAALTFIRHLVTGQAWPKDLNELRNAQATLRASFVDAIHRNACCRCPVAWGAGPFGQVIQALSEELLKHGVPKDKVETRSQQAIKAIGSENVANALKSKNVWRSLKAVGSNVRFQFILPDELEAAAQANKSAPVGRKQKAAPLRTKPSMPEVIDPTKLALMDGTFRSAGEPVSQIAVQQLGPLARGVALISLEEALPYINAGKAVSSEPLALAIIAPAGTDVKSCLPHSKVMIPCMCVANREPLLVEATLLQLGRGLIEKHVASSAIALDQLDAATLKMMVYHDEFAGQWEDFISSPIKHLVHLFPLLRRCPTPDCKCEHWHNPDQLPVKDPIMDVWRRQFLSASFKTVAATKAVIFSVCVRVPADLVRLLLPQSGVSGVYMEPRTPDGREILDTYSVVWTPKMPQSAMTHLKQTNPAIVGFARLGDRKGFRVVATHAQEMHELVRPEPSFLPSGPKSQFVAGPFPLGVRSASFGQSDEANWVECEGSSASSTSAR